MYTLEERMKAVELYLKWGRDSAAVRRELGYPSRKALRLWVNEYETTARSMMGTVRANPDTPRNRNRLRSKVTKSALGLVPMLQLTTMPSKQSIIVDKYTLPAGIWNSVMSVSHLALGAAA